MDYLYSLYDALTSINVPTDKARAVVDAMERDMGTTIATKTDLQMMSAASKADLELLRQDTQAQFALVRQDMKAQFEQMRQDTSAESQLVRQEMRTEIALVRKEIEVQAGKTILTLGGMLFLGFGAVIATLQVLAG
jgi:hypothetical protein